jgi:glycosyltransferase involved in cell wall biosynthesis
MALLEAMACGKPPVVRDIPTFDWLEDGETCLKATQDFTAAIEQLTSDEARRASIGQQAALASEQYELGAVSDELVDLYRSLV